MARQEPRPPGGTKDRKPWLACHEVHDLFRAVLGDATAWLLGRDVIMPDHIHFFAGYAGGDVPYENWVKYWKSQFTQRYRHDDCRWQPDHWDTRVRSAAAYEEKWLYIVDNPVRAGLAARAEDWPYRGELFELRW